MTKAKYKYARRRLREARVFREQITVDNTATETISNIPGRNRANPRPQPKRVLL